MDSPPLLDLRLSGIIDAMEQNVNGNKTITLNNLALMIDNGLNEVHRKDVISRVEFDDLMERVKFIEMKLGIMSGK